MHNSRIYIETFFRYLVTFLLLTATVTTVASELPTPAEINATVNEKTETMDSVHGLLLSHQEQVDLQTTLIAQAVVQHLAAKKAAGQEITIDEAIAEAFAIYQINDSYQQRQLIIMVTASKGAGPTGNEPPK